MMEKRLYKSRNDKMLFGVCAGVAEYFNVDPTLIRLAAVVLVFTSVGVPAYIIAAIVMPEAPREATTAQPKEEVVVEAEVEDVTEETEE
jgi:phage shock protein C